MPSLIYNRGVENVARGTIDFDTDTFRVLLTTASYTENKDTHDFRDDVTNEVAAGGGYSSGGNVVTVTVTRDDANDRVDISLGGTTWPTSTITARIEALRFAVQSLTRSIGFALPSTQGWPIMEVRQPTAANLNVTLASTTISSGTVTTVSTLTNQSQQGGFATNDYVPTIMRMGADNLRRNIVVT